MISDVNSVGRAQFDPKVYQQQDAVKSHFEPLTSFADEDEAIISSEAKMMNELDKFNAGGDNLLELVESSVNAKITTQAEARVIDTKKQMLDTILGMGE